jgi:hypothetical protein
MRAAPATRFLACRAFRLLRYVATHCTPRAYEDRGTPAVLIMGVGTMRGFITVCIFLVASLGSAAAEENNYEAGKTPAALFASNCGMCHKSPKGLGAGMGSGALNSYLAEHYTASAASANELTRYLLSANAGVGPKDAREAAPARRTRSATTHRKKTKDQNAKEKGASAEAPAKQN